MCAYLEEPDLDAVRRPVHCVRAAPVLGERSAERALARFLLNTASFVAGSLRTVSSQSNLGPENARCR
jgi:hypothetical protein